MSAQHYRQHIMQWLVYGAALPKAFMIGMKRTEVPPAGTPTSRSSFTQVLAQVGDPDCH